MIKRLSPYARKILLVAGLFLFWVLFFSHVKIKDYAYAKNYAHCNVEPVKYDIDYASRQLSENLKWVAKDGQISRFEENLGKNYLSLPLTRLEPMKPKELTQIERLNLRARNGISSVASAYFKIFDISFDRKNCALKTNASHTSKLGA